MPKTTSFLNTFILLISVCIISFGGFIIYEAYFNDGEIFTENLDSIKSEGSLINETEKDKLDSSGITGEDYINNSEFYPYYEFLNDNEKKLYAQVLANSIELETTFIPTSLVNITELNRSIEALFNDHPELFWLDTSYNYIYTKDERIAQVTLKFNETVDNFEENKLLFEASAYKIIEGANKLSTDYLKEKYVHDSLINSSTYKLDASLNQSAYSTLVNHVSVCAGYARAFQYIMTKLGIPTFYVIGQAKGEHAWNIIKLDGEYYNVDLTWDDQSKISYNYFNVTDADISSSHKRISLSLLLPACKNSYKHKENVYNYDS